MRDPMAEERLELLCVSQFPASPATFGAQRRIEGLLSALSRRHRVTALCLAGPEFDPRAGEQAMRRYCDEVVLVQVPSEAGARKRLVQLGALVSPWSYERHALSHRGLQHALDGLLLGRRYDFVLVEAPYLAHYRYRQAPAGARPPGLLVDEHNIEYELARRSRDASRAGLRWLHHAVNWRKIMREELAAWRTADGVVFTSRDDEARARAHLPGLRSVVAPNAVDVSYFRPGPELPAPDGETVLFFGTLNYFPNQDGMLYFLRDIWPRLEREHPRARLKVVGPQPTPEVLAYRGPRVEVAGLVEDLRTHLAQATVVIVPLRVGGGTRFKILEAMALGKPVVSTTIGAEGIEVTPGADILIADDPGSFAAEVARVLDDVALARRLGEAGRALVEQRYSWEASAAALEGFMGELARSTAPAA
jgi:glycosyltransferase involved in cell wall biosynthesis